MAIPPGRFYYRIINIILYLMTPIPFLLTENKSFFIQQQNQKPTTRVEIFTESPLYDRTHRINKNGAHIQTIMCTSKTINPISIQLIILCTRGQPFIPRTPHTFGSVIHNLLGGAARCNLSSRVRTTIKFQTIAPQRAQRKLYILSCHEVSEKYRVYKRT